MTEIVWWNFLLCIYYWWKIQVREFTNTQSLMKMKKMFAGKIKLASVGSEESDSNLVTGGGAPLLPGWTWVMPVWGQTDVWAEVRSYSILRLAFREWEPHHTRLCSRGTIFFFFFFLPWTIRAGVSHYIDILLSSFSPKLKEKTLMEKLFPFHFVRLLRWNGFRVPHNTDYRF